MYFQLYLFFWTFFSESNMGSSSSSSCTNNENAILTRTTTQQNVKRLNKFNIVITRVSIWTKLVEDGLFDIYLILNHIFYYIYIYTYMYYKQIQCCCEFWLFSHIYYISMWTSSIWIGKI